jgi:flagellar protein FlbD
VIEVTRLDGTALVVNADHVLTVERTPDTVVLLTTGVHLMVRESVEEVVDRAAAWQRRLRGPERRATVLPFPRGAPSEE